MNRLWATRLPIGIVVFEAVLCLCLVGCQKSEPTEQKKEGPPMSIIVSSGAFAAGQPIPTKYSGEGQDISPPLSWSGVPAETKEIVLICDDPDAPTPQPWVHWVIYKIPGDVTALEENVAKSPQPAVPAGTLQGRNSWPKVGYGGPMPPVGHGMHHYYFKVYALDAPLDLPAGQDKAAVLAAMKGHILAEGELIGTYERK